MMALTAMPVQQPDYCIVDVSAGPAATNYPVVFSASPPLFDIRARTMVIPLRRVSAGSFTMGSPTNEPGRFINERQHDVCLTTAFYIGVFEISQAQYSNVMGSNPSAFRQGDHAPCRPVENVSWQMVRGGKWPRGVPQPDSFLGRLRACTGRAFDLPTEAQWEYACRAGQAVAPTGLDDDEALNSAGRYFWNGGSRWWDDPVAGAHAAVGSLATNSLGLFDMQGNVREWCLDWYAFRYGGGPTNPAGSVTGKFRVVRGGGWSDGAAECRAADRMMAAPDDADSQTGFRIVLPAR